MTERGLPRVVLVGCSGILGDILADAVRKEPGLTIVSNLDTIDSLDQTVLDLHPDVILWNHADEAALADSVDCFVSAPPPKILGTVSDGRDTVLWELQPRRTRLGQLSPDALISTIRAVVAP
jgi:hypothetical protein